MKKIILLIAIMGALVCAASCGNHQGASASQQADTTVVATDSTAVDTTVVAQ